MGHGRSIPALLLALPLLGGCPIAAGVLATVSVAGVEYTASSVAHKVLPEGNREVRRAVDRALARMRLPIERGWKTDEEGDVITARARLHRVEVRLEEVSRRATRLQVDARRSSLPLLKDRALAAAVITETERELGIGP